MYRPLFELTAKYKWPAKFYHAFKLKIMLPGEFRVDVAGIRAILIDELGGQALDIKLAIFDNNPLVFTGTKPTTELILGGFITNFTAKRNLYKQGGMSAKIPYDSAHTDLLDCLISLAPYVNGIATAAPNPEDIFKLSMIPYWDGINDTATRIKNGAVPTGLNYTPGATGVAKTACAPFGSGTKYNCIAVQGNPFPPGTSMSLDGQIILPLNALMPSCVVNINGRRLKTLVNLTPKTDYYLYYIMMCGVYTSGLSLPLKIAGGN